MKKRNFYKAFVAAALLIVAPNYVLAQAGTNAAEVGAKQDSVIIFESPRPLLEKPEEVASSYLNTWGISAFFSDYGFGGGAYYAHSFSQDIRAVLSLDFGTAKGPNEFGLSTEIKINRIFVLPVIASIQYRLFREMISENFKPFITGGVGPVFVLTTPGQDEFFSSFGHSSVKMVPGGFVGVGANFGIDRKSTFGANLRYYIIPYPAPGIESTQGVFLRDLSGLFLTVNYGFNF